LIDVTLVARVADDFELLEAWRGGDKQAANALFDRYFEPLYCFFRNKVEDGCAEDLVQQTFLACLQAIGGFRGDASFRTYLFRAARSKLYDHLTARFRRGKAIDPDATSSADLGVMPSFARTTREQHTLLLHALRRLPLEHQVTVELYYFEGMHAPELAVILDLPEGTVRTRLRRALQLLRERLAELQSGQRPVESDAPELEGWAAEIRRVVLADRKE
jgi:RNA polymerase sigma factor (sigma-70 family)